MKRITKWTASSSGGWGYSTCAWSLSPFPSLSPRPLWPQDDSSRAKIRLAADCLTAVECESAWNPSWIFLIIFSLTSLMRLVQICGCVCVCVWLCACVQSTWVWIFTQVLCVCFLLSFVYMEASHPYLYVCPHDVGVWTCVVCSPNYFSMSVMCLHVFLCVLMW